MKTFACVGIGFLIMVVGGLITFCLLRGCPNVKEYERGYIGPYVLENTRSYNAAKLEDLDKYRLEYIGAINQAEKEAIAATIRFRFSDYQVNERMPAELNDFWVEINR